MGLSALLYLCCLSQGAAAAAAGSIWAPPGLVEWPPHPWPVVSMPAVVFVFM